MEWMGDPSVGSWLVDRIDSFFGASMHGVVPRGYEAYARVFHPATVRSLPGRAVPTAHEWERMPAAEQQRLIELFEDRPTTWSDVAAAFRTSLHPLAQWQSLVRTPQGEDWRTRISPDGREFSAPDEGQLPAGLLSVIAGHLAAHTSTPDAGIAALWEGWGGLTGGLGHTSSRVFFEVGGDPRHEEMLGRSIHDPLNNAFRTPTWQDGILSREVSEGPRLELTGRTHILFTASVREFTDPAWILQAPWRDLPAEEHGFAPSALSPSIIWPDDRAWTLVSEVDFDSTVIGGSSALVSAICADGRLEALPIPVDADLGWDADPVNR